MRGCLRCAPDDIPDIVLCYDINSIRSVELVQLDTVPSLKLPAETLDKYLVTIVRYPRIQFRQKHFSGTRHHVHATRPPRIGILRALLWH